MKVGKGSGVSHIDSIDRALSTIKVSSTDSMSFFNLMGNVLVSEKNCVPVFFSVYLDDEETDSFFSLSKEEGAVFLLRGEERDNVFLLEEGNE